MTERQALALLGPPDDIVTPEDRERSPSRLHLLPTERQWCYGTNGHLTFPTLGWVILDGGEVRAVAGGKGTPPQPSLFKEADLCILLRVLDKVPDPMRVRWNPLPVIQAVNALQPLGKEKAIAALAEFGRVTAVARTPDELRAKDWEGIENMGLYVVLNTLFDAPPLPEGYPSWFDWALVGDVPLISRPRGGAAPSGFRHADLEHYRSKGMLRPRPLRPVDHPWRLLGRLSFPDRGTPGLGHEPGREISRLDAMDELLRLLEPVYPTESGRLGYKQPLDGIPEEGWQKVVRDLETRDIRWDPRRNCYVDGAGGAGKVR
jgi:hypothetical protein